VIEQRRTTTPQETTQFVQEFIDELRRISALSWHTPVSREPLLVAVAGFPGSGKSRVAKKIATSLRAVHIQANSARELLRQKSLSWNVSGNVTTLIGAVAEKLLTEGFSLVCDGGVLEEAEEAQLRELATRHHAKLFLVAVPCRLTLAEARAKTRNADGKPSSFEDWRPSRLEAYIDSMAEREEKLGDLIRRNPSVLVVDNNESKEQLAQDTGHIITYISHQR
jgi:predicted kinase